MTPVQLAQLAALPHELPGVEFKPPGSVFDKTPFARVVRAMLGMVNREGGGTVVVGVNENAGNYTWDGVAPADRATWTHDNVADQLVQYAEPPIEFTLEIQQHNGRDFVLIEVREFDEIPVLCRKESKVLTKAGPDPEYEIILRKGACYVRPRHKHETSEIATQEDMRDLIRLATEKGVRKWVAQAVRTGAIGLSTAGSAALAADDASKFESEIRDLK